MGNRCMSWDHLYVTPKINLVLFVCDHQMTMYLQFVIGYFNSVQESTLYFTTDCGETLSLYFFHTQKNVPSNVHHLFLIFFNRFAKKLR
jgi:hypothetical protein